MISCEISIKQDKLTYLIKFKLLWTGKNIYKSHSMVKNIPATANPIFILYAIDKMNHMNKAMVKPVIILAATK